MPDREWTGSVANLPESMRALALNFMEKAHKHDDSPLASYLRDEAHTLSEWADAVELLYARLDEGEVPTNAQGVALARFLRGFFREGQSPNYATVVRGGGGLPADYLFVRMGDGYEGGIAPDGSTST